jgi:uncharacterized protein (TIGR03437 family)
MPSRRYLRFVFMMVTGLTLCVAREAKAQTADAWDVILYHNPAWDPTQGNPPSLLILGSGSCFDSNRQRIAFAPNTSAASLASPASACALSDFGFNIPATYFMTSVGYDSYNCLIPSPYYSTAPSTTEYVRACLIPNGSTSYLFLNIVVGYTVAPSPSLQITPATLSKATSGQPYTMTFTATGGSGTGYAWSLASGTLPSGFTLSAAGVLSSTGTPAATAQTYTFTVKVTDSASNTATQPLTLVVQPGIQITPTTLSKATSGQPYTATFAATGGSGNGYTWSLASGSLPLPSGFTLSAAGVLSTTGTPAATAQTYTFSVEVTDSANNSAMQSLTLIVLPTCDSILTGALTICGPPANRFQCRQPAMTAVFAPNGVNLADAATACNVASFNFQQWTTVLPLPNSFYAAPAPTTPLKAPPAYLDPPQGGYTYQPDTAFPFYWNATDLGPTGKYDSGPFGGPLLPIQTSTSLVFSDAPTNWCFFGGLGGIGCVVSEALNHLNSPFAPPGSFSEYATALVGVDKTGNPVSLSNMSWTWRSNFNGTSGGIAKVKNSGGVDPGSGTGGVAVVSINGVALSTPQLLPQAIIFAALNSVALGGAPFSVNTLIATSGLSVSLASNTPPVCTVVGATVTVVATGTCSLTATQAGNSAYAAAPPVTQTFAVTGQTQTITFGQLGNVTFGVAPFPISATASSGLPVTFASSSQSICTVTGSTVAIVGAGLCSITASQSGNATFGAATPITVAFTVNKANQSITFTPIGQHVITDAPFALQATASSGLPVTFVVSSGPATISGTTVALTGIGTVTIQVNQAGSSNYNAAQPVGQTFSVVAATPMITSILNAASYANGPLAGSSYAVLFGSGLAAQTGDPLTVVSVTDAQGNQNKASLYYVGTGQINFIVPAGVTGPASVTVSNGFGSSAHFPINIGVISPGLFTLDPAQTIPAAQMLILAADGSQTDQLVASCSGTPLVCAPLPIPLKAGTQVFLILYGTGIRGRSGLSGVSVTLGGVAAPVLYAGPQGTYPALDQVNVGVPLSLAGAGAVDLKLTVDGTATNTVKVTFQ